MRFEEDGWRSKREEQRKVFSKKVYHQREKFREIHKCTRSMYDLNGNSQCGELRHVAEGERSQRADAVVAQIPA